jgi:hypothetical protein
MSLFNRKKSTFFDHILKTTDDAKIHTVTNRNNSLTVLNNTLDSTFKNWITKIKNNLINKIEINAKASRNSTMYCLCTIITDPIVVDIPGTNDNINLSNFILSTFVSGDIKRKVTVNFNGFTFSGNELIDFPSVTTIIEQLCSMSEFNNFTFKVGTTYKGVNPETIIIVEW